MDKSYIRARLSYLAHIAQDALHSITVLVKAISDLDNDFLDKEKLDG
jgi:hypothetical protein